MNKYLSVFYLAVKQSFRKILILWLISFIIQGALCLFSAVSADLTVTPVITIEDLFDNVYIPLIFCLTLAVTAGFLTVSKKQTESKTAYTLRRLLVREKSVFYIRTAYNALVLFTFFILSLVFYFFVSCAVIKQLPENYFSSQAVYMSLYNYNFFHNLFAGRDILRIIRNILVIFSIAANLSADRFFRSRNSIWAISYFSVLNAGNLFAKGADMSNITVDILEITISAVLIFATVIGVHTKEKKYE